MEVPTIVGKTFSNWAHIYDPLISEGVLISQDNKGIANQLVSLLSEKAFRDKQIGEIGNSESLAVHLSSASKIANTIENEIAARVNRQSSN